MTSAFFSSLWNPICERLQAPKEPKPGLPPFHFLLKPQHFQKVLANCSMKCPSIWVYLLFSRDLEFRLYLLGRNITVYLPYLR